MSDLPRSTFCPSLSLSFTKIFRHDFISLHDNGNVQTRPEFGKAASVITKEISATPIIFASLNCGEAGRRVCNKYDIKQLPTLKLFRDRA